MFSEIAKIAFVAARLEQLLQFRKTRVILILDFTRPMRLPIQKQLTLESLFVAINHIWLTR